MILNEVFMTISGKQQLFWKAVPNNMAIGHIHCIQREIPHDNLKIMILLMGFLIHCTLKHTM